MESLSLWSSIVLILILVGTLFFYFLGNKATHENDLVISKLYVFPVKGIQGCPLTEARLGPYGVEGDRTFCLQKVHRNEDGTDPRYETMLIGYYLRLALFAASIDYERQEVSISWTGDDKDDTISFPLKPSTEGREVREVDLHTSKTKAYDMGDELAAWFSRYLEQEVRFVYIGDGSRPVLGSMAPNSKRGLKQAGLLQQIKGAIPGLAYPPERFAFTDIAHYLVVTEESNNQVSSRLEDGCLMDITKFRPNIVLRGASGPFVEDYWGELIFTGGVHMALTANCYRCQSITVDYKTGKTATDDRGMVWKKINKDRRVDKGAKYSPVFGRYGYCYGNATSRSLKVGQQVSLSRLNAKRTTFDWPHLTSFGVTQTKK